LVGEVTGAVEFDDFIGEVVLPGFIVLPVDVVFPGVMVFIGVVATAIGVLAGVEGLVLALLAGVSPQAIPNAPSPRTAESKITFFICLQTPIFLKD
jgi:hypothetical protein